MVDDLNPNEFFAQYSAPYPEPGMLLVAMPGLGDERLNRSVILILQADDDVVFGVDLAHRTDVAAFNVVPEWIGAISKPQVMYLGGPVAHDALVGVGVLSPTATITGHPHLYQVSNRVAHVDMRAEPSTVAPHLAGLRIFFGYAEWTPRQLQEEIDENAWFIAPCLADDVIAPASVDLWGTVLRRQPMPLPLFSTYPKWVGEN